MVVPVLILVAVLGAAPRAALSLELVAPAEECSFSDGKVVVIGMGTKSPTGQGKLKWEGGEVPLSARAGRFYGAATLSPGTHEATLTFGDETLELCWAVSPQVPAKQYEYHPGVTNLECKTCHDPEAPPPPSQDTGPLCYGCHTKYTARSAVHQPVTKGLCTACHDPHGSINPAFLRRSAVELCQTCHNRPIDKAHEKHKDDEPCTECHDPHGSSRAHNLRRR